MPLSLCFVLLATCSDMPHCHCVCVSYWQLAAACLIAKSLCLSSLRRILAVPQAVRSGSCGGVPPHGRTSRRLWRASSPRRPPGKLIRCLRLACPLPSLRLWRRPLPPLPSGPLALDWRADEAHGIIWVGHILDRQCTSWIQCSAVRV